MRRGEEMKPFQIVAVPHDDVVEGRLTNEVFAADLWEVFKGTAPIDYRSSERFFEKTFMTRGLQNLIDVVEKRLHGEGGDPVIQIETPFGGGKTHALIALYHKGEEWGAKRAVVAGTVLSGNVRLWELLEEQLTGKVELLKGEASPGRERIKRLLLDNRPVLILMDEVLEYVTKAAGVKVGETTLAAQTLAFLQELSEAVSVTPGTALVITLPSSRMEHFDENAEEAYAKLKKISGRLEKVFSPVDDDEISQIIRRRLFKSIDMEEVKKEVREFMEYAERNSILPIGMEPSEYRKRFESSYPFLPEVIDVLYQRWGSFPNFQRTRGVLRLLAMVIHSVKDKNLPYISLADFDLSNQGIRRELLEFAGNEFDGIINSDITSQSSGARKAEANLGESYRHLNLGVRAATTIFMYSFSGGKERGATKREIKRSATTLHNPASVVGDLIDELSKTLFYLQTDGEKYFFTTKPNINRLILLKMENVHEHQIEEAEREFLKKKAGSGIKVYVWPESPSDIPDTPEFKLVILKEENNEFAERILSTKGSSPRIFRNTLFFLFPTESGKKELENAIRRLIAFKEILSDRNLELDKEEIERLKKELKELETRTEELLRNAYRLLKIPAKSGLKEEDLGAPIYGEGKKLSEEVLEFLINRNEILRKIAPVVIVHKYLNSKEAVLIKDIYDASLKTRGEVRFKGLDTLVNSVKEGVKEGIFGVGTEKDGKVKCVYFKEEPISLDENWYIVKPEICDESKVEEREVPKSASDRTVNLLAESQELNYSSEIKTTSVTEDYIDKVEFEIELPKGRVYEVSKLLNFLDSKFSNVTIKVVATGGRISKSEDEQLIQETLRQLREY